MKRAIALAAIVVLAIAGCGTRVGTIEPHITSVSGAK